VVSCKGTNPYYTVILNYNTIVHVKLFLIFHRPTPIRFRTKGSRGPLAQRVILFVRSSGVNARQMAKSGGRPYGSDRDWKIVTVCLRSGSQLRAVRFRAYLGAQVGDRRRKLSNR
jgi:hypothetical protein